MPEPDTANDDTQDKPVVTPTLDEIHRIEQAKVEAEDDDNEGDTSGDQDGTTDTTEDKSDDEGKDTSDSDSTASADEGDKGSGSASDDSSGADSSETSAKPAPELDTDTLKPGDGKVAVKSFDGKTYYFNSLDEIPEDFEPSSYKETMRAGKEFARKEQADEVATETAKVTAQQAEAKQRADDLQESWEKDATTLVQAGVLPNKPDELEAAKEEVYSYIEAEMKKGNIITNFNQAYKAMKYDERIEQDKADQKKSNDLKKKRGGMVQSGSGGSSPSTNSNKGRTIEAPPAGIGLDAVHNRAIESLS